MNFVRLNISVAFRNIRFAYKLFRWVFVLISVERVSRRKSHILNIKQYHIYPPLTVHIGNCTIYRNLFLTFLSDTTESQWQPMTKKMFRPRIQRTDNMLHYSSWCRWNEASSTCRILYRCVGLYIKLTRHTPVFLQHFIRIRENNDENQNMVPCYACRMLIYSIMHWTWNLQYYKYDIRYTDKRHKFQIYCIRFHYIIIPMSMCKIV